MLNAKVDVDSGYYQLQCPSSSASSSNVTFGFNGAKIDVPLDNLSIKDDDGKHCGLAIQSTSDHQIFGDVFLSSAYVIFDLDLLQISLAQVKYTNESDTEEIEDEVPGAIFYTDLDQSDSGDDSDDNDDNDDSDDSNNDDGASSLRSIARSCYVSGSSIPSRSRTHHIEHSSIHSISSSRASSRSSKLSSISSKVVGYGLKEKREYYYTATVVKRSKAACSNCFANGSLSMWFIVGLLCFSFGIVMI